jgi:tRNA modification GTPase
VAAVENALGALTGLRRAEAGEFTRRAFANGRIDLAEAEGLADLLSAETELQRRSALAMAEGALSQAANMWRSQLLGLSAALEAILDFSDEDDVSALPDDFPVRCLTLAAEIGQWLSRPRAEPLREGFRVVLAGPPNAGKSTLFNALVQKEAAITASEPGTTRDVLTQSVSLDGVPFTFVDTAGLRSEGAGEVELVGIARAKAAAAEADLVLWLGPEGAGPNGVSLWEIAAQSDRGTSKTRPDHAVSAKSGEGMTGLRTALVEHARAAMPRPGEAALNRRQHGLLAMCAAALSAGAGQSDPILAAEELRSARVALDRLLGNAGVEDMLDALFGRFCIGK